ncbi:purine-nucleoside phosphorylase [Streptomonospora nanhaiensis]|uniref:Purine nucleoside phosphorylase n=1 Tax=Streptomonospora nanhaiensis TaxID=1323731 RepID=A0A853BRQ9_9ACTN|nr:purine-nucleoside phosphorylase [Streptomonospora nanhaiensis]MBV2367216.1 purine-nucleoside phosphorylase [Streptomonospora nanhaiensis]MBX9390645.1 purine-nucleoside phosphorylase [Streptomonospora nanhaiensis]NYI97670.1 purine-nucleoside phosphorylase [Streptomonospora nanhaiensis]
MSESTQVRPTTGTAQAKRLAAQAADELKARTGADSYDAMVILGSGWAGAADTLGVADIELDMTELPGFVAPTALGHQTKVRSTWVDSKRVVVFCGRTHLYEEHDPMRIAHAVRTGIAAGASTVVLTGAAGSLRADFAVGQPIVLRDHINLTATSPLAGPDFVDLTAAYSPRLRRIVADVDPSLAEGVYASLLGPQFQTPAELGMLRNAGADLVGRSFALETIAAVEMGAEVLGVAVVSNDAVGAVFEPFDTLRALDVIQQRAQRLGSLLNATLALA